jgi:hypothetical protein
MALFEPWICDISVGNFRALPGNEIAENAGKVGS